MLEAYPKNSEIDNDCMRKIRKSLPAIKKKKAKDILAKCQIITTAKVIVIAQMTTQK